MDLKEETWEDKAVHDMTKEKYDIFLAKIKNKRIGVTISDESPFKDLKFMEMESWEDDPWIYDGRFRVSQKEQELKSERKGERVSPMHSLQEGFCEAYNVRSLVYKERYPMLLFDPFAKEVTQLTNIIEISKTQAKSLKLLYKITEGVGGKPIFVMRWTVMDPSFPSAMLNCNTHLYLVNPENWKHHNNDTFSNSTHDMICISVQHLKAIPGPKQDERSLKTTLHFRFVTDGYLQYSNVGFGTIKGLAYTDREIPAYVRERNVFWKKVICFSNTREGSRSQENNTEFTLMYVRTVNTLSLIHI